MNQFPVLLACNIQEARDLGIRAIERPQRLVAVEQDHVGEAVQGCQAHAEGIDSCMICAERTRKDMVRLQV